MGHEYVDLTTSPVALDDETGFQSTQAYSLQCTGMGGMIEEQKNIYEVRILLADSAPDPDDEDDMEEAFKKSQVLVAKGERFVYRAQTGEKCYLWCQYGPSRVSYVETT